MLIGLVVVMIYDGAGDSDYEMRVSNCRIRTESDTVTSQFGSEA